MNTLAGISNAEYHSDTTHLSSSGLKLLLQDPQQFYHEYVLGNRVTKESDALTEGSLVHSLILEPHLVEKQYAIYHGRRIGREYEAWLKTIGKKTAVTNSQMLRATELADACKKSTDLICLTQGLAEHSMTSKIADVALKARADYIDPGLGYIVDVKTTSKATGDFAETIDMFAYDLSAALYCQIARDTFGSDFVFYWIVLSKLDKKVSVIAASEGDLRVGREKVDEALSIYKECIRTGIWQRPKQKTISYGGKSNMKTFKTNKGTELPLMQLKGKDYLQVAHRLVWLNDEHVRFNIETEFPVLTDEQTVCRAKVLVCSEHGEALKMATATKRETKKDFSDHTEKAETGAVGRALAMLGLGTQFAQADLDEGDRIVDAPTIPAKKSKKDDF